MSVIHSPLSFFSSTWEIPESPMMGIIFQRVLLEIVSDVAVERYIGFRLIHSYRDRIALRTYVARIGNCPEDVILGKIAL